MNPTLNIDNKPDIDNYTFCNVINTVCKIDSKRIMKIICAGFPKARGILTLVIFDSAVALFRPLNCQYLIRLTPTGLAVDCQNALKRTLR